MSKPDPFVSFWNIHLVLLLLLLILVCVDGWTGWSIWRSKQESGSEEEKFVLDSISRFEWPAGSYTINTCSE